MLCSWLVISSMPGGAMISTPSEGAWISSSSSRSSSAPSRSILRKRWRVSVLSPAFEDPGSSASSKRSSAASRARLRTATIASSRTIFTAMSARSRMIESTSRPT